MPQHHRSPRRPCPGVLPGQQVGAKGEQLATLRGHHLPGLVVVVVVVVVRTSPARVSAMQRVGAKDRSCHMAKHLPGLGFYLIGFDEVNSSFNYIMRLYLIYLILILI